MSTPSTKSPAVAEVTTESPKDPRWNQVRELTANLRTLGHQLARGPIVLGMLLASLKKEHQAAGGGRGGDRKSMGGNRPLIDWPTLVEQQSGYSRRQADDFIRLYDAFLPKLRASKKLSAIGVSKKDAIVLFDSANPLALTPEQWSDVDAIISTVTTAESMSGLMQELGIIPKPKPMPAATKGKGSKEENTAGQLAFHFFEGMISPLVNSRTNPDYQKLLYALPFESDEEHPLSLATLEAEFRAALADIEEVKAKAHKAARGKTINV